MVERPELPKVSVALATRAGGVRDPAGKGGLGSLTARAMRRGTKTRKALEIENTLGDLGTSLTSAAGRESARLGLRGAEAESLAGARGPRRRGAAAVIPGRGIRSREEAGARRARAGRQQSAGASPTASPPCWRSVRTIPMDGRPPACPSTVGSITRDDLSRVPPGAVEAGQLGAGVRRRHHAGRGDGARASSTSAAGRAGRRRRSTVAAPQPVGPGKIYLIDRQDAAQTVVATCCRRRARPRRITTRCTLADAVWGGGGFGTRLNLNLREDKGYSYGVFSNAALLRHAGAVIASGGVQTDKTKESVVEFDHRAEGPGRREADFRDRAHGRAPHQDSRLCPAVRIAGPRVGAGRQSVGAGAADDRAAAGA